MRFATVRDLKNRTSEMLRMAASGKPVLITSHGKPIAILQGMTQDDIEDFVLANDPELRASYEQGLRDIRRGRGIPLETVIRELKQRVEKGRRRGGLRR